MRPFKPRRARSAGFSMIEVLITLLIVLLGLMGLAGLITRMQQAEFESYQRAQALILLQDMVDRIRVHRVTATCFPFTTEVDGTPFLGVGSGAAPACSAGTANDNAKAVETLEDWSSLLKGAGERKGGVAVGAMVGARGCVRYQADSELLNPDGTPIPQTGLYTVAVSWQGTNDTVAPTVNCANGLYGSETRRRTVSTAFRIASLK